MTASYSMMFDWKTGGVTFRGTDGRTYTEAELVAAETNAARGDADAIAILAAIKQPPPASREEAQARLEAEMHDCPLCQEARAHGDEPVIVSSADAAELHGWMSQYRREQEPPRPTNWWHGRRKQRGRR